MMISRQESRWTRVCSDARSRPASTPLSRDSLSARVMSRWALAETSTANARSSRANAASFCRKIQAIVRQASAACCASSCAKSRHVRITSPVVSSWSSAAARVAESADTVSPTQPSRNVLRASCAKSVLRGARSGKRARLVRDAAVFTRVLEAALRVLHFIERGSLTCGEKIGWRAHGEELQRCPRERRDRRVLRKRILEQRSARAARAFGSREPAIFPGFRDHDSPSRARAPALLPAPTPSPAPGPSDCGTCAKCVGACGTQYADCQRKCFGQPDLPSQQACAAQCPSVLDCAKNCPCARLLRARPTGTLVSLVLRFARSMRPPIDGFDSPLPSSRRAAASR